MKSCKKRSAIASKIPGMADGGRATPGMLGWGMANNAGRLLEGRGRQIDAAVNNAVSGAPAAPATPTAPAGVGGMSRIRDGAMPPANMLLAQRRGMADGGQFQAGIDLRQQGNDRVVEAALAPPNRVDVRGRPVNPNRTPYGYRGYDPSREPLKDAYESARINAGMETGQQIRDRLKINPAQLRQRAGMADGGDTRREEAGEVDGGLDEMERGNADEIETGDGGTVRGPGGPTDDRVGPVALANTEYVLPADTVKALGGPKVLDAIRAATHKFVDPKNKPGITKGLRNGGLPGYEVGEVPAEEISMGRSRADRAAIDDAVRRGQRPPGMAKNPTNTPALDRVSNRIQASSAPKPPAGRAAGIAKGIGAVGLTMGAADSLSDLGNGYRDYSQDALGVETPAGSVAADTFRTLNNVGNAVTFGLAGRVGRGIASATDGKGFMDGFASPSDREQFIAQQAGAQAAPMPAAGQPAAGAQANPAAAQAGTAATTAAVPATPKIGKINVTRQPNGVMSFSGSGPVQGYDGPAAGQLKGGGFMTTPGNAGISPALSNELAAARQAAAARGDYQGAIDSITAEQNGFKQEPRTQQVAMRAPQTFGEAMQFRAQMAMNRLNQRANESDSREQTDRLRIAAGLQQSPYDQERTRGAKMENDRSAMLSKMVDTYLNAPDEATRTEALTKLNALNGKNGGADKYITVDMEAGVDALGNPIIRKVPFNTRTGQIVDVNGGAGNGAGAKSGGYPDGTELKGADGLLYVVKDGVPVRK